MAERAHNSLAFLQDFALYIQDEGSEMCALLSALEESSSTTPPDGDEQFASAGDVQAWVTARLGSCSQKAAETLANRLPAKYWGVFQTVTTVRFQLQETIRQNIRKEVEAALQMLEKMDCVIFANSDASDPLREEITQIKRQFMDSISPSTTLHGSGQYLSGSPHSANEAVLKTCHEWECMLKLEVAMRKILLPLTHQLLGLNNSEGNSEDSEDSSGEDI